MKIKITSIKKVVLETENFDYISIPTKMGEITILDSHEPIITTIKPGIMKIKYNGKNEMYAIGGGIIETDGKVLNIIADMVEDGKRLDIDEIKKKKEETRLLMEQYKKEGKTMDIDVLISLETEFLKESAKEQLALL